MNRAILFGVVLFVGFALPETYADNPFPQVFRIDAGENSGSAVLLKVEHEGNAAYGWFVTCFHVLHKTQGFTISQGGPTIGTHHDALVHVRNLADLVLIRAKLQQNDVAGLKPQFSMEDNTEQRLKKSHKASDAQVEGWASGYSFLSSNTKAEVSVRLWGHRSFSEVVTPDGKLIVTLSDRQRPAFATFLGNEITMPGMSGGVVVTHDGKFGGIVFARIAGVQGLAISADTVLAALDEAEELEGQGNLPNFHPGIMDRSLAFNDQLQPTWTQAYGESCVEWESLDQWSLAFRSDNEQSSLFQKFLECEVDLRSVNLTAKIAVQSDQKNGTHQFLLNGVPVGTDGILNLQPGENLLVINKRRNARPLGLNDLFSGDNKLDVSLIEVDSEERTLFKVRRSLPNVIDSYSVFVTILCTGESPKAWPSLPGTTKRNSTEWQTFQPLPDAFRANLANCKVDWQVLETDLRSGSTAKGSIRLTNLADTKVRVVSRQTIDLQIPVELVIEKILINQFGLRAKFDGKDDQTPIEVLITVRFQIHSNAPGESRVSARAMSALTTGKTNLTIPLLGSGSDSFGLDISPLLSHFSVVYLNQALFKPSNSDASVENDLLAAIAGEAEDQFVKLIPRVIGLEDSDSPFLTVDQLSVLITPDRHWSARLSGTLKFDEIEVAAGKKIVDGDLRVQLQCAATPTGNFDGLVCFEKLAEKVVSIVTNGVSGGELAGTLHFRFGNNLAVEQITSPSERILDAFVGKQTEKSCEQLFEESKLK